jgi:hypothetical protein
MPVKRPPKKPKIIQVITDNQGYLIGVLYDNGRVFLWNYTKFPNKGLQDMGEGVWSELNYPNLNETNTPNGAGSNAPKNNKERQWTKTKM